MIRGKRRVCNQEEEQRDTTYSTKVVKRFVLSNMQVKEMSLTLGYMGRFQSRYKRHDGDGTQTCDANPVTAHIVMFPRSELETRLYLQGPMFSSCKRES